MSTLSESFEAVADWCERHLEATRGREVGMTFGAAIRTLGRLATRGQGLHDDQPSRQLDAQADAMLLDFCTRFLVAHGWHEAEPKRLAEPGMQSTNMTYDPGPRD